MPLTDNAVAFWDLDADVLDDSGNGANGTNNGVTFGGGIGNFASPHDIAIPGGLLSANTWTLSLWFNATSLPTYQAVLSYHPADNDSLEFFTSNEDGTGGGWVPNYQFSGGAGTRLPVPTFSAGTLYHLAASMAAGTVKVYVNGSLAKTGVGLYSTFATAGTLGSRSGSFFFTGTMQSVGLFSDAKDAAWVASLYNSGVPMKWADMAGGSGGGTPVGADAMHHYREHIMRGGGF